MAFTAFGFAVASVWFAAINIAFSAAVACVTPRIVRRASRLAPASRAHVLLGARLLPSIAAAAFAALLFAPSYFELEPPGNLDEACGPTLLAASAATIALLAHAIWRAASAWWCTKQRVNAWMRQATTIALPGCDDPAYCIAADRPALALVGIVAPRLLVTRSLIDALSAEELAVSVAHESGHGRARDNLKRLAMRSAPDALWFWPAAARLEREWAIAAEFAADEQATRPGGPRAIALASALVSIARLNPLPRLGSDQTSTLVGDGAIASRVRRLIEPPCDDAIDRRRSRRWIAAAVAGAVALAAGYAPLLAVVHEASEVLVHALP